MKINNLLKAPNERRKDDWQRVAIRAHEHELIAFFHIDFLKCHIQELL